MPPRNLLVSWIGHADLLAMAAEIGDAGKALLEEAKVPFRPVERPGPLKTAVDVGTWDGIHLLSNYGPALNKAYGKWLGGKPTIHPVELNDPTDYDGIFRCTNQVLGEISKSSEKTPPAISILLSPGTPAMAVVWVLLGKSRYPASFYQTSRGKLTEARIPADLFEEVVPELLRDRDLAWQHLATRNPADVAGFENIVGQSQAIRLAVGRAQRAALRDVPVLLLGESGTGKEMFAQAIHAASRRRGKPFEAINCAAIPRELLEAELFGHEKGAFTGADKSRPGAFERADGGTLFLDEIGECDPLLQTKLLRVLQPPPGKGPCHREFRPVGGHQPRTADVRLVAATNRDLQAEIQAQRFREDLYYRLAVITLELPPLRNRPADIPLLAHRFLDQINHEFERDEPGFEYKKLSAAAIEFVKRFEWPGNVRQLYNALVQAAVLAEGHVLERSDFVAALGEIPDKRLTGASLVDRPLGDGFDIEEHLNGIQREYLRRAMKESRGVKTQAARLLGMKNYQTLDAQLKRLDVSGVWGE
jgi:DNA-binding NtrC family response regulator